MLPIQRAIAPARTPKITRGTHTEVSFRKFYYCERSHNLFFFATLGATPRLPGYATWRTYVWHAYHAPYQSVRSGGVTSESVAPNGPDKKSLCAVLTVVLNRGSILVSSYTSPHLSLRVGWRDGCVG